MLALLSRIFGSANARAVKRLARHVPTINALEPRMEALSDDALRAQTAALRARLAKGETLEALLPEAFATVREAAKRTLGQRHFDVQLIGGVALHEGRIAEMRTGEGKTLVATLPVYLNALTGQGVHVVTVNDYLAQRDAGWMGQVYRFLGLSVGCIVAGLKDHERREAYAADVTYGTNNEFGFDYLRDNMKFSLEQMVQREFHYAIVDEVDSILIDEARTPLIISGPAEGSTDLYGKVDRVIPDLVEADYEKDEKQKNITLTEEGVEHVESLLRAAGLMPDGGLYDIQNIDLVHHVSQALRAHKMYARDTDYIVKDGKVVLIDEFTGRMMDGRRLSEGLHQALEAKEGAQVLSENQTLASITFQNYFRLYPKLAGMTGTAMTEAAEFAEIYNLPVVDIPTHRPVARTDHDDKIYKSLREKEESVIALVKDCHARGQPVLVGTVSIDKSEQLSAALKKAKVRHNVLNARHHDREAAIIAQAGRLGAVTIATNMAGRGTDIQLGGNPEMAEGATWDVEGEKAKVLAAGGLYVIGTERHESRRIDNQLRGRSGRQGDPGATMFFLSVEDDLVRVFAGDRLEALLANPSIGLREGEALEHPLISKMLQRAQGKVEAMHFEIRKNLLKFDNVMNDQRKVIYEQRREIMAAPEVEDIVRDMRHDVADALVADVAPAGTYPEKWDAKGLSAGAQRLLALEVDAAAWFGEEGITPEAVAQRLRTAADEKMAAKAAGVGLPVWRGVEKSLLLQLLDQHWKDHLLALDHLRQGINLRAYAQKDPLNEYKTEAFGMFEAMLDALRESVTQTLSVVEVSVGAPPPVPRARTGPVHEGRGEDPAARAAAQRPETVRHRFDPADPATWTKTPRNAPCPCGSGKKYKHCHGRVS
ncbi:MAG TPA: preprotein translocase subunit SecA [Rhodospirillaceae bacterium]|mgnify:CR=1 FL=1|jgi:preprotein translocase subunit SecA|nr:preprotein translocase subunit SecA [Alphaproteobacteria bacterium]HBH26979.1 preprotein translocase subunit SecA [Rhodospirillaceae bacterium]